MKRLLHLWARLKRLQWRDIRRLMVLCVTAFVMSASVTGLDIGTTTLLLNKQGIASIGFNYLLVAFILVIAGSVALRLERRRGYGASRTACVIALLWWGLFGWFCATNNVYAIDLMFVTKYGTIFLMNVVFWALAERYVKLAMSSLKFLGVFCFETIGIGAGALLASNGTPTDIVRFAIIGLLGCVVLFKILGWLNPIPKETFIQKIGGVQDEAEKVIVDTILAISFCWTFLHGLTEFQVYTSIVETAANPIQILSRIYMIFASCTLAVLIFLAQARFLYTMQVGLALCAASAGICGAGAILHISELVYVGAVIFFVTSRFYISRYLSLLPRPLAVGKGVRLKKMRWLVMRPCAYILLGALLLTTAWSVMGWILIGGMGVLSVLFVLSAHLYGRQLVKMCALRIWRGGPMLLAYPPLKQMIRQGLSKTNAAEVIYFLNVLEEGYTGEYRKLLVQMLHHPAISVRLFVLNKMKKLGLTLKEKRQVSELMKTDSCEEVRNMALALLITDSLESHGNITWTKYKEYVDDPKWRWGVCMGFLFGRGAWIEKIVNDVIKMANSQKEKDNLIALSIMQAHPRQDWTESIGRLLNKTEIPVVKSALIAAGKVKSLALLNRLLPMLDEMRWRDPVLETLIQYGKQAFPSIEKMILSESVPLDRQKELILFLGRLPSGEGKQILLRSLFGASRLLRRAIIESLGDSEIVWVHEDRKKVLRKAIQKTVSEWYEMNEMLIQTENLEHEKLIKIKGLFQEAIQEEMSRTRLLILDQVALYINTPLATEAVNTLKGNDLNAYAGAASCLQDVLHKKLYEKVRAVLVYPTIKEPPEGIVEMPVGVFLNRFILNPFSWTNAWLQALALCGWRELNDPAGLVAVQEGLKAKDWIVLEAALAALGKLEKNKKRAQEMALGVPTQYLLKQNFETLLEGKHVDYH